MTNPLAFEIVVDPDETLRASQEIARRARTIGNQAVALLWLVIPFAMIIGFRAPARVALGFVVLMGVVGLLAFIWPRLRRRQLARFYASAPALAGPQRYEFIDEGLAISNTSVNHLVRWSGFIEAAETPEFFLLYYAKRCAYYIPRRTMESETQVDDLRRLLRARLGARATHVAPPT